MRWADYIDNLMSQPLVFDDIRMMVSGTVCSITPVVKASILMHEDLLAANELLNVFVFPDNSRKKVEFLLGKALCNILSGRIHSSYDPHTFTKGQKLGYKDCVVIFEECKVCNYRGTPEEYIVISLSDGTTQQLPISIAPVFQKVESKRVSSVKAFDKVYSALAALAKKQSGNRDNDIDELKNSMTHLDSSIVYVSEVKRMVSLLQNASVDGDDLKNYMHIAKITGNGDIVNIFSGQKKGNPAIVIASDLFSVLNAKENGLNIQSIILDDSSSGNILNQMSALDKAIRLNCPITLLSSQESTIDNTPFIERGFNEWRWDQDTITDSLVRSSSNSDEDKKVSNCINQKIEYRTIDDSLVSDSVKCLYNCKDIMDDQSQAVLGVFERLFSLCFTALRNVTPNRSDFYIKVLDECDEKLDTEKRFVSQELYDDLKTATVCLCEALAENSINGKMEVIKKVLSNEPARRICIVISEKQDKMAISDYWSNMRKNYKKEGSVTVMYSQEYVRSADEFDLTIVVGWLNYKTMRGVLHHYISPRIMVLLYPCEERWQSSHVRRWHSLVDKTSNREKTAKSLGRGKITIEFEQHEPKIPIITSKPDSDEMADIEVFLAQKKYEQYGRSKESGLEFVTAYPISFVGDYFAFYKEGHDIITVTDIVFQEGDEIAKITPDKLRIGDFVVERSSGQDLIREIADEILLSDRKQACREIAAKWKEPLKIETVFTSPGELVKKIQSAGCSKNKATILNWLTNPDIIIPNDKEDLLYIAQALEDEVLLEKSDVIFAAGKEVRAAHIKAGKVLSERLKSRIPDILARMEVVDPYNIWDPIEEEVEGIGEIRILKVIDIASKMDVEPVNTNRIINEMR